MAGYQNLFLNVGETFTTSLTLDDSNGLPYDLNTFTVKSQARKSYYSANPTIDFVASISDASNGVITLSANSSVMSNVSAGILVYDTFIIETSTGITTKVLEGQIFINNSVTRL